VLTTGIAVSVVYFPPAWASAHRPRARCRRTARRAGERDEMRDAKGRLLPRQCLTPHRCPSLASRDSPLPARLNNDAVAPVFIAGHSPVFVRLQFGGPARATGSGLSTLLRLPPDPVSLPRSRQHHKSSQQTVLTIRTGPENESCQLRIYRIGLRCHIKLPPFLCLPRYVV
jgi:hypothetical protein